MLRRRLRVVALACLTSFAAVEARMFVLQAIQGADLEARALDGVRRREVLPAPRGRLLDRSGRTLAEDLPAWDVRADDDDGRVQELLGRAPRDGAWRGVSQEEMVRLGTAWPPIESLAVVPRWVRVWPEGPAAAHVVGYVGSIRRDEMLGIGAQRYRSDDVIGRTGAESEWEGTLRGTSGARLIERTGAGGAGGRADVLDVVPPVPGADVRLSIDRDLQREAWKELDGRNGSAVVLSVATGEVLALASAPSFDPHALRPPVDSEAARAILGDEDRPLVDRAAQGAYPAGSIFKIVTAVAALEEGVVDPSHRVTCTGSVSVGGRRFRCWKPHGTVDLAEAIEQSCNVYFYHLGRALGPDRLTRWARAFGYGEATGVDLPTEVAALVPTPEWKERRTGSKWAEGDTVNLSIGQGALLVTPLQAARAAVVLASGGLRLVPHLVPEAHADAPDTVMLSERTRRTVLDGMRRVVGGDHGTARSASVDGVEVLGKTGSAQAPGGAAHAWFVGMAPAADPRLVTVVLVERGMSGGAVAAPRGGRLLGRAVELGY